MAFYLPVILSQPRLSSLKNVTHVPKGKINMYIFGVGNS